MRRRLLPLAVVLLIFAPAGCGDADESPLGGARTFYESLDLSTPVAAVETFVNAFARDDFMTVWLVLDSQAQFRHQQLSNLLEYDQLVRSALVDMGAELSQVLRFETMEMNDSWYVFDQFMLIADRHDAFLIDLSGGVTFGEVNTTGEAADIPAQVEGIEGDVRFRMVESPTGRWRVHQVIVPGGDEESIPWSVPPGSG